jgi:hypothetical protein
MVASYPASLKVFSAKADGETIFGAHMNEVQEEIAALQSILGIAPQGAAASVKLRIAALETGKSDTGHTHDHGALTGLTDNDHPQYILHSLADANGDLLAATADNTVGRLAIGTNGWVLTADSTQATGMRWAAPASAYIASTIIDAKGDLIVGSAADASSRLAVGTDGWVLTADSAQALGVKWAALPSGSLNVSTIDAKGDLLVGTANDAVSRLAAGTNGYVLVADSAQATGLRWAAAPDGAIALTLADAKGDLFVATAADTVARLPVGTNGYVLTAASGQATGLQWASAAKTIRIPHTWHVPGDVKVAVGDTDYILPFFIPEPAGQQTVTIVGARHRINSGTSVTAKLTLDGVDVTGFTGISVTTTTATTDPTDVVVADGQALALVVTAIAGTPKNMTFTVWLEYVI